MPAHRRRGRGRHVDKACVRKVESPWGLFGPKPNQLLAYIEATAAGATAPIGASQEAESRSSSTFVRRPRTRTREKREGRWAPRLLVEVAKSSLSFGQTVVGSV